VLEGLKKSRKAIGARQSLKAIENGTAKLVFVAKDADEKVTGNIIKSCQCHSVELVYTDSMIQLGKACGIEVGAAAVAVLKEDERRCMNADI